MDNDQSGATCQSASKQASGLPLAADCVQDRRQREVQRDYGVSHGTDQNVLKRAKRLVPGQGPAYCAADDGSARSAKRAPAQAAMSHRAFDFDACLIAVRIMDSCPCVAT
ncbi:MAG: hypothetical protein WBY93_20945 [Candidatus Binatus sp.]